MTFGEVLGASAFGVVALFALVFAICNARRRYGWVDVTWCVGVALVVITGAVTMEVTTARSCLVAGMVALWALRLASHLAARLRAHERAGRDDPRYERMAAAAKRPAIVFFAFFQAQAMFVLLFALTPLAAMQREGPLDSLDLIGVTVWFIGVVLSGLADRQLRAARTSTDTGVCERGLWSWSRHPNYFFEWVSSCGFIFIGAADPVFGAICFATPTAELLLLFTVTGIAPAEISSLHRRKAKYVSYQDRVPRFVPFLPEERAVLARLQTGSDS
ncbi:MAG: DUF1295 domain-containing protein [Planctomycetota bacterium]